MDVEAVKPIAGTLRRSLLATVVLGGIMLAITLIALQVTRQAAAPSIASRMSVFHAALGIQSEAAAAIEEAFAYVVSGETIERDEFEHWSAAFAAQSAQFRALLASDEPDDSKATSLVDSIVVRQAQLDSESQAMFAHYDSNGRVAKDVFVRFESAVDSMLADIDVLVNIAEQSLLVAQQDARKALSNSKIALILISAAGFIGAIAFAIFVHRIFSSQYRALVRLGQERQQMIANLKRKNDDLQELAYMVSHDMKSPLITIEGFSVTLAEDVAAGDAERTRDDLMQISNAVQRMTHLYEALLHYVQLDRDHADAAPVSLTVIAKQAVDICRGQIERAAATVTVDPDLGTVSGHENLLIHLYQNLFDNAAKYSQGQTDARIHAGSRLDNSSGRIYFVADNGSGISAAHRKTAFKAFEKGGDKFQGVGLGLSIVKRVIERHGGRVWIEDGIESRGIAVCFTLAAA